MAVKNTRLGGTDWTDDVPLVAADLNDTFDAAVDEVEKVNNKVGFCLETIQDSNADNTMYSAGDVIAKFKITGGTGNNIENISANVDFYTSYSTRPTYRIQYSTDNSAWTTIATEPTAIANTTLGASGGIAGTVDGLANDTYYIRVIGESQSSYTSINNFDLNFRTANGPGKTITIKRVSMKIVTAAVAALTSVLDAAATSATDNIVLPVVISAPNGETITSVSALGHIYGDLQSNSSTATSSLEYSTDGTTYAAMDEGNSETFSGNTGEGWNHQNYGMKESLSSNDVYVSFNVVKGATGQALRVAHAHLFVVATY